MTERPQVQLLQVHKVLKGESKRLNTTRAKAIATASLQSVLEPLVIQHPIKLCIILHKDREQMRKFFTDLKSRICSVVNVFRVWHRVASASGPIKLELETRKTE